MSLRITGLIVAVMLGIGVAVGAAYVFIMSKVDIVNNIGPVAHLTRISELPPQCGTVRIKNPNGSITWWRFCGTGSNGTSPLEEGVSGHGPLLMDGSSVKTFGCGTEANPCIVVWPNSPVAIP